MPKKLSSLVIVTLLLCMGALFLAYNHERRQHVALDSELVKTKLLAEGYREGLVKRDLIKDAPPEIKPAVVAAKKAGATPAVVTVTKWKEVGVVLPCDDISPRLVDVPTTTHPPTHVHTMNLSADSYSTLALLPNGAPLFATRLFLNISNGDDQRIELEPDTQNSSLEMSREVRRAFDYWTNRPPRITLVPRPIKYWRAGFVVGVGALVSPITGRADAGVFAGYGVQF